jgi:hypothetical protein
LNWQGAWNSSSTYNLNDAVGYTGSSWFCIATISVPSAVNPYLDTINWALLSSQGSPGINGSQGIQGPTGAAGVAITFQRKFDVVGNYSYCGSAQTGLTAGDPNWIITRIDFSIPGSPVSYKATGSWENKTTLTYTI